MSEPTRRDIISKWIVAAGTLYGFGRALYDFAQPSREERERELEVSNLREIKAIRSGRPGRTKNFTDLNNQYNGLLDEIGKNIVHLKFTTSDGATANGSGVLLDNRGHIATDAHEIVDIIADANATIKVILHLQNGAETELEVSVLVSVRKQDAAILKISDPRWVDSDFLAKSGLKPATHQHDGYVPTEGEERLSVGYLDKKLHAVKITSNGSVPIVATTCMEISATDRYILEGTSGGGVYDLEGNLKAITRGRVLGHQIATTPIEFFDTLLQTTLDKNEPINKPASPPACKILSRRELFFPSP
jgi:hypothetical protein